MSKKVNLLICFVLVLSLGSNVLALDRVQPDFAGGDQACAVLWEFEDGNSATKDVNNLPSLILYYGPEQPPDACFGFRYDGFSYEGVDDPNLAWVWDSNATVVVPEEESVIQPIPEGEGANLTVQAQVMWWPGPNTPNGPGDTPYLAFLIETWVGRGVERDVFAGADEYAMEGVGNEEGVIGITPIEEVNIAPGWKHSTYSHTFTNFRADEEITHVHILCFGYEHGTEGLKIDEIVVDMVVHNGATPPTGPGREWLLVPRAGQARKPDPARGEEHVQPNTNLSWAPDPCLAGPLTYDVYFGTDPNMANNPKIASNIGANTVDPCSGGDLATATPHYWRVDTNDGGTVHAGIDFIFTTWGLADDLYPADEATEIPPPVLLQWGPDGYATTCDVYFGTSFAEVNDATTSSAEWKGNQAVSDANYNTGMLDLLKPHYWRIDEKDGGGTAVKGAVWSFKTGSYFDVEDFDRYPSNTQLYAVWDDYWTNGTGSEVFVEKDANFTRDGNSLRFLYDCGTAYKKVGAIADADIADMLIGGDWTIAGIKSMVLYFYGDPCNIVTSNDRMWVQLEDTSANAGTKLYGDGDGEDPNDVKLVGWTEWNIDLNDANFSGVSLSNVGKIHIGFGGPPIGQSKAGGSGKVWFDDIQLHPQRCRSELVAWDIAGDDCITDGYDIDLMSDDWLIKDYQVFPAPPDRNDLLVEYLFDPCADHNDLYDSSGNGYHGEPSGSLWHVANGYLTIEAEGGYVDIPFGANNPFHGPNDFSVVMEYRSSALANTALLTSTDPCLPTEWDLPGIDYEALFGLYSPMSLSINQEDPGGPTPPELTFMYANFFVDGTDVNKTDAAGIGAWHYVAATYDADGGQQGATGLVTVYIDGIKGATPLAIDPNIPEDPNYDVVRIGDASNQLHKDDMGFGTHIGDINEVLIFDVALTESEVYYLSGIMVPTYKPNTSLANVVPKSPPGGPYDANNPDIVNLLDFGLLGEYWLEAPLLWP
ncbi:MAG: hypothetical protein JSV99_12065 [Planctomycetota bacterium]|nr:MAG: hypothetical protein JSV99_12065 [Planctomycetota bacterium]